MSKLDYSDLIGNAYEERGRGPKTWDCFGLWMEVNRRVGIVVPDYEQIMIEFSQTIPQKVAELKPKFIHPNKLEIGDLLLIKSETYQTDHIGVIVSSIEFLHVLKKHGVIRTALANYFWRDRIEGIYRYVG